MCSPMNQNRGLGLDIPVEFWPQTQIINPTITPQLIYVKQGDAELIRQSILGELWFPYLQLNFPYADKKCSRFASALTKSYWISMKLTGKEGKYRLVPNPYHLRKGQPRHRPSSSWETTTTYAIC
jgi:hypothetical protein